ncbi:TetR/AcrR family transcriptional regulator [Actinoplanes couchii]|uniref:TetR/AcrR family transcriptional regulator n=1 Tax=Actinoplanes couchii TaxID=403638 RepID=UPI0019443964|nr:TetR/AcrR family transcriptional regulator [Actinoplanes couchii]MDR6321620.1 AcrR family transcriptional regulator [Actinoplanes couchii]
MDHALANGLPDRLEPLATAAGVSTRMLIYHFRTRDGLLRETLIRARRRQRDLFGELLAARPGEPYLTTLRTAWRMMTGEAGRPYLSMFGKLRDDAEQKLWPGFRREATVDWLQPLEQGLGTIGRPELGTLVLAVIRGLIMDVESTGDVARVDRAFEEFLSGIGVGGAGEGGIGEGVAGEGVAGEGSVGVNGAGESGVGAKSLGGAGTVQN